VLLPVVGQADRRDEGSDAVVHDGGVDASVARGAGDAALGATVAIDRLPAAGVAP